MQWLVTPKKRKCKSLMCWWYHIKRQSRDALLFKSNLNSPVAPPSVIHRSQGAPGSVPISRSARVIGHCIVFKWNAATLAWGSFLMARCGWWHLAWDHALSLLSLYVWSLTGRGHDTFLCRITCKKARIWTFFWLDRKQYGWFALFRLAKMPPSVSCCWFQSAFLLA